MELFKESERKENNNEEVMEESYLLNEYKGFIDYEKVVNFFIENNIELTDEQDEALYSTLTESDTGIQDKSFERNYVNCMEHMLKYRYTTNKQSVSWLNTIRNASLKLNEIYSIGSERYKIDNLPDKELSRFYKNAVAKAKEEGNDTSKYPKTLPEEFMVKNLANLDAVNEYVNKYKSNDYAVRELERRNNNLFVMSERSNRKKKK